MARPRKYIDRKLMKELSLAQLTNAEIARCLKVSPDTIERRYAAAIKEWRKIGVGSVRRELFVTAMGESKGKVTAAIFFLKNYGGMTDVVRQENAIEPNVRPISARDSSSTKTAGTALPVQ